ncbi:MAG: beta-lactamase family protein [Pseudomonadales bacterium]|nr:beta-lactamase family protein [Pseudomonadales bacterium]
MSRKRTYLAGGISLILILLAWRALPVYLFFAYADGSTLPAAAWNELPANAPQQQRIGDEAFRTVGDALMAPMDTHRIGIGAAAISAAVLIGDEVIWAATSGWADIENRTAATPDTRFRIGSTSKALTATGLARLIEADKIDLDTPLSALWDDLPNPAWSAMTPRQLGSHMAGLPHYGENTDWRGLLHTLVLRDHYDSVHDAVSLFDESDLLFAPGSDFFYSSYGTVLLSAAMSKAADAPYLSVMQELVFDPNDMSGVVVSASNPATQSNMSTPYHHNGKSGDELRLRRWRNVDLSHRLAGGGFAATSTDLVKLGRSYFVGANPDAIATEISREMWTPQVLDSGEVNEQGYGIGWRVREEEFLPGQRFMHVNHGGVSRGGQSWLMLIPQEEMAIALNINGRTDVFWDFGSFSYKIASAFLARKLSLDEQRMQTSQQQIH